MELYHFEALVNALFPATCACCGEVLMTGERQVCVGCLANLSRTGYSAYPENPVEQSLLGIPCLGNATAMLHYSKGNTVQHLVHAMKFHGRTELCKIMGRQLGLDLMGSGRFDDVDLLLPVPLHWRRKVARGYNQSELLCRGMAEVMRRPISSGDLVRFKYTRKQSRQTREQRGSNVEGAFRVRRQQRLEGKHVLLVDDVMTTGATLKACADALATVPGIRISVAALSKAGS